RAARSGEERRPFTPAGAVRPTDQGRAAARMPRLMGNGRSGRRLIGGSGHRTADGVRPPAGRRAEGRRGSGEPPVRGGGRADRAGAAAEGRARCGCAVPRPSPVRTLDGREAGTVHWREPTGWYRGAKGGGGSEGIAGAWSG